jgi:hypothetical protein
MGAKPGEQGFESMTIFLTDRDESQAEAVAALYVSH